MITYTPRTDSSWALIHSGSSWIIILIGLVIAVFPVLLFRWMRRRGDTKAQTLAEQLGFQFFPRQSIPAEFASRTLFKSFRWLIVGSMEGTRVLFGESTAAGRGQANIVTFSLFEKPLTVDEKEAQMMQEKARRFFTTPQNIVVNSQGVFAYNCMRWGGVTSENDIPTMQAVAQAARAVSHKNE